jgi:pyruvate/2-oxoacid:ferredoxin oxidoreductase beta subunit
MTGGQCSSTTPQEPVVGSGFLNRLEKPMDICQVTGAAGRRFCDPEFRPPIQLTWSMR